MQKRLMSAAALVTVATISVTGCSGKDTVNKVKNAASAAATSSVGQKAINKAKDKASAAMGGKSGGASASPAASGAPAAGAAGGATVNLGKFAKNPNAKAVGAYFTQKRKGKKGAFEVNVVAVKGNKVSACVGPKGKRSQTVIVAKKKVKAVRKGTAKCA